MKLCDSIEMYVTKKRTAGLIFYKGESNLLAFHRYVGDLHLDQINTGQVQMYLDKVHISTATWRLKYQVLERFFEFWHFRGEIPQFSMPPPRAPVRQSFIPYIFTRSEIRGLLKATVNNQRPIRRVEKQTLRTFILILYATGALVGEVLNLKLEDVDLKAGMITMTGGGASRSRQIPIGEDMHDVLKKYLTWRSRRNLTNAYLLVTKHDFQFPSASSKRTGRGSEVSPELSVATAVRINLECMT
jgi:integrase